MKNQARNLSGYRPGNGYRVLALCLCLFAPMLWAQTRVVVDDANPPFMYAGADGRAEGLYPAILRAVFKRMDQPLEVLAVPWKRALIMSRDGTAGIGGLYKNTERLKVYDYSDRIFSEKLLLYVPADKTFPFSGLDDLKGKHLGVIRGWSYGNQFDAARRDGLFKTESVRSDANNFLKLAAGRIDAVVAIEVSGRAALKKLGLQKRIVPLNHPIAVNDTYLAFSQSWNERALLARFNKALTGMRRDGSFARLVQSIIAPQEPAEPVAAPGPSR